MCALVLWSSRCIIVIWLGTLNIVGRRDSNPQLLVSLKLLDYRWSRSVQFQTCGSQRRLNRDKIIHMYMWLQLIWYKNNMATITFFICQRRTYHHKHPIFIERLLLNWLWPEVWVPLGAAVRIWPLPGIMGKKRTGRHRCLPIGTLLSW